MINDAMLNQKVSRYMMVILHILIINIRIL